ncbi:ABC transporter ATP-binding protein [Carboxydothermus hydrogenoformans]|uniref:ABC transporter, ATP-binding protein n=1 Tax=Carboxydothermus hydrogenoformans (strain ATCC BAA-161 / DSM 6008 / Z-2901) TaxID=246194 RepID=Q3AEX5_CARHZ|nr:ABC transporter ATP-binding protein [Carboxydothermus hydrogenoformans]ABB14287.1 ABC transporter, ATP-binding protein [Carboxydothermus hydrogenoformans Z-2901]
MVLEVKNLSKQIRGKQILSNVSFSLEKGEVLALIGPNGAGKTTTIKCIINALKKDEGEVILFGKPFANEVKTRIAVVPEDRKVFRNFTAADYRSLWQGLYPAWNDAFFKDFVVRYNFNLNQKVESYSIGQRTLFLLGLALSSGAELLLLDEPTQHLDPTIRNEVIHLINQYARLGNSLLVSSHEIFELEEYATTFAIIKNGKVLYTDSIDDAKQKHRIIRRGESFKEGEVIGMIHDEILLKTSDDIGMYPKLNHIVVGYLQGKSADLNLAEDLKEN